MMMRRLASLTVAVLFVFAQQSVRAAEFTLEKSNDGVTVKLDGKLFTQYLTKSGAKPILWPVVGPYGNEVTRAYPMVADGKPGEKKDHHHHRSFWFTHGDVNGISFWHENAEHGNIVHREFLKVAEGRQAVISTVNDWNGPDGKKICEDIRTFTFGSDGDTRWIDVDIRVVASEGDLKFGDTKEGSFGIRVAGTMKETAGEGGRLVNDKGQTSAAAWGKPAAWVDYHGPVEGNKVGVAILNHPSSFRYPTHWHVRTYGLFAANPFGLHDFSGRKKEVDGSHTMKKGESFDLHYRVLIHKGDEKAGKVAEHFERYAKQMRP
jgi:hypothetical protein